ncbi:hypothetical protein [Neorhizobium galegae]|uniref:hypothetical protein n=1 Tax=Neorhizobium galegae TaxID=399 RepID=UPI000627DB6A|nr:hypothetical protein [Neorhizobium galegae]
MGVLRQAGVIPQQARPGHYSRPSQDRQTRCGDNGQKSPALKKAHLDPKSGTEWRIVVRDYVTNRLQGFSSGRQCLEMLEHTGRVRLPAGEQLKYSHPSNSFDKIASAGTASSWINRQEQ